MCNLIDIPAAQQVPAGTYELFYVFSRFEFALKDCGFVKCVRHGVAADWDKFVSEKLDKCFYYEIKSGECASTLLNNPPQKQIMKNNQLQWNGCSKPTNAKELISAVRRVRNNLFHGGKGKSNDKDRDECLIAEAKCVLIKALERSQDLKQKFENG